MPKPDAFGTISGGPLEPEPMPEAGSRFSERAVAELEEIVSHYPERRAAMLPALWLAQREYGGRLTPAALREVAQRLGRPYAEVEGVATFYTMYNLRPVGRHHLEVCTCLTCGCVGAYDVLHALEKKLGIEAGEVTPDGEFSLNEVECLDWCEAGTVIQVGKRYYGRVTPETVDAMLEDVRASSENSTVEQADTIVRIQMRGGSEARE